MKTISVFLTALLFTAWAGGSATKNSDGKPAEDDLFDQPRVLRLSIELAPAAIETLRKDPKTYVKGVVREGSMPYRDVAIRLKGNGSFQGLDQKPGLALKFNEFVQGQKFHGHSKILLNNSRQDPTYLCEAVAGQIFRDAGVPSARTTFAKVELNGRDAGIYVVAEAVNKDFLARSFKKSKGNLYEGSNNDVTDKLEKDSGDDATDQKDLKALAKAAQDPDATQRWKKLTPVLDLDRFVTFAAVEVFVWHRDGYSMDRNNFRIYGDPNSGQLVFLPHGMDLLFGQPGGTLWPEWKGLVARAVLGTPEGVQRYRERMATIVSGPGKVETVHARIQQLAAVVRPALSEKDAKDFDAAVSRLRDGVAKRSAFLETELKKPQAATK